MNGAQPQNMNVQRMAFSGPADGSSLGLIDPQDWQMPGGGQMMAGWWLLPMVFMGALMWYWLIQLVLN
jgi:hypothetical protein